MAVPSPAPPLPSAPLSGERVDCPRRRDVVDYYDALEALLSPSRQAGELRTHFGIAPEAPPDYCFIKACTLPARHPQMFRFLREAAARLHERIFAPYDPAPRGRVLDVGCGVGGTLAELSRRWPLARFDGVNVNRQQVRQARQQLADRANIQLHHCCFLEWQPAYRYDLVYFLESAFHIFRKKRLAELLGQLCAPAGELCVVDVFASDRLQPALQKVKETASVFSYLSRRRWDELLTRHGFRVTQFDDLSRQVTSTIVIRTPYVDYLDGILAPVLKTSGDGQHWAQRAEEIYLGYQKLHRMLDRGLASYGILRARREELPSRGRPPG